MLLLSGIDSTTGVGQLPALQVVAHELSTTEETIRSYLKRLVKDTVILKSDGTGRGVKAKGVVYAFTTHVSTPSGADGPATASSTISNIHVPCIAYPEEVRTELHANGGNGIELWLQHGLLPDMITERIRQALASGKGASLIVRLAHELWHWHNSGMERHELMSAVENTFDDFMGIAANRARRAGRINDGEHLDVNSLTPSKFLDALLRAMGRHSLTMGLTTPEAGRILEGKRRRQLAQAAKAEAERARVEQAAFAYRAAKDPDLATEYRPEREDKGE